jgi:3-ketoacyl-CoA synthase
LAFIEGSNAIKRGDTIWQIAFGSGLKCNSAIWKSLQSVHDKKHIKWNLDGIDAGEN